MEAAHHLTAAEGGAEGAETRRTRTPFTPNKTGFIISLSRQLAKHDASGDHTGYAVVYINLRFDDCGAPAEVAPLSRSASPADLDEARAIPAELPALRHAIEHPARAVNIEIARTDL